MENIFDLTTTDFSLYNAFCKQTRRTFWTFLHTLAQQEDIYSTYLADFGPYKDSPVDYYVFSTGKETTEAQIACSSEGTDSAKR